MNLNVKLNRIPSEQAYFKIYRTNVKNSVQNSDNKDAWIIDYSGNINVNRIILNDFSELITISYLDIDIYSKDIPTISSEVEDYLIAPYAIIFMHDGNLVIKSDFCGQMPIVYDKYDKIIASSPSIITNKPYCKQKIDDVRDRDVYFPFGITAKPGVFRLLPGSVLPFADFSPKRLREAENLDVSNKPYEKIDEITNILESLFLNLSKRSKIALQLTAGRDSRALIACSKGFGNISTFTRVIDKNAEWDSLIAEKIAKSLSVEHQSVPFHPVTPTEREQWLESVGYSVGGRISHGFRTNPKIEDAWTISGKCGELGRNYYSTPVGPIDPKKIIDILRLAPNNENLNLAENWLSPIRYLDNRKIIDLLYLEIRLGCWAGPQNISLRSDRGIITPFGMRKISELMLQIPPRLRERDWLPQQIISRAEPSLLKFPFEKNYGNREKLRIFLSNIGAHYAASKILRRN